jgi:fructose-1,6-bisphosphatase/inositol monophosphatase family enzyme
MPELENEAWGERLLTLGLAVQTQVVRLVQKAFRDGTSTLAEAVCEEGGDRIYRIDREVESTIEEAIADWPDECLPLLLIAEGMGSDGRMLFGDPQQAPRWRLIIDPIDGTRMLMYDKRSAWFLAAVCLDKGEATTLADSVASVMVELPPSKQTMADAFVASLGKPTRGLRFYVDESQPPLINDAVEFPVRPSSKVDLQDGFATVLSMFPGTRQLAADLAERIAERCGVMTSLPTVFDDQYISCGGLMYQLMTGRDLCCLDLRPQFNQILGRSGDERFIESHPYDLAGLLTTQSTGVIMTNGLGQPLNAPLDVHTGVDWCGYANSHIRNLVEPIVHEWLAEYGIAKTQ